MTDTDQPPRSTSAEADPDELGVVVDALTGEVLTGVTDNDSGAAVATNAHSTGTSPELHTDPYGEEQLDMSREEFEKLLGEYAEDLQDIREGEIVQAKVLHVTENAVVLEFGFKSEGSVALDEFKEQPQQGEQVEVLLESLEDDDGVVVQP